MSREKHKHTLPVCLFAVLVATNFLLAGCGKTEVQERDGTPAPSPQPYTYTPPPSASPTPSPSPSPAPAFMPAYTFSFSMTGSNGAAPTYTASGINTDNVLKIRVNSGPASNLTVPNLYSNFTANYSCISYTISVLGRTVVTQTLSVPNGDPHFSQCPGAPQNQVIDFSDRLSPGHGPVSVQVTAARYDFYCQLWFRGWVPGDYYMYCPMRTVYQNHTVTGSLDIQVNGTTLTP